jgi:RNA polymerase sigma factor (sigma-70 family)
VENPLDQIDVEQLCRGDAAVWREFVLAAAPRLRAIVSRALTPAGRGADVPDVLQEIFSRLCRDDFRLLRTFDPRRGRLATWLAVLAARAAVDHLRKHHAAPAPLDAAIAPIVRPSTAERALSLPSDLLSPQQELILRLCYEDDLGVAEISALLRIEAQTVRSQRHKALERLRAFLAERKFF